MLRLILSFFLVVSAALLQTQWKQEVKAPEVQITNQVITQRLKLAQNWLLNNVNTQTGILEYSYNPATNTYSTKNNDIRQIATIWAETELSLFLEDNSLDALAKNSLDYYLKQEQPTIAHKAFLILALLNTPTYPQRDKLISRLAQEILEEQKTDGSFNTDRVASQDYYPGEAMLALTKLHNETQDKKYLDAVVKALPSYRNYWRKNKNTAFIPWQTQTYFLAYQAEKNQEFANFIFEMNDWLVEQNVKAAHYMEGVNDAYSLAVILEDQERIKKYGEVIKSGTEFILSIQITQQSSFPNPKRAIGGFTRSPNENLQRIDYTQHAIMALIKTHSNKIYK